MRPGSSVAHRCNLVCIRRTRGQACSKLGHGSPVFTSASLPLQSAIREPAGPLRPADGFPVLPGRSRLLRLLRVLRPACRPSVDDAPTRSHPRGTRAGDGNLQAVPTFTHQLVVGVGRQLCPCSLVTATPQSFTVTSRPATSTGRGVPHPVMRGRVRAAIQPTSTGFELALLLRGVTALVSLVHLPVSLAGPAPSGRWRLVALDVPGEDLVRPGGDEFRLDRSRVGGLDPAFPALPGPAQQPVERRARPEVDALVEQNRPDLGGDQVAEPVAVQRVEDRLALDRAQRPRLGPVECQAILDALHSDRFVDLAPTEVGAILLDEGAYLGPVSPFYRLLRRAGESRERRVQATHPAAVKPELVATGPNQVFSWDITK